MTWYARSWMHIESVRQAKQAEGADAAQVTKAIDKSYPYYGRSGWAYKAWLEARRDFFRKHQLPLQKARKPGPGLLIQVVGGPSG